MGTCSRSRNTSTDCWTHSWFRRSSDEAICRRHDGPLRLQSLSQTAEFLTARRRRGAKCASALRQLFEHSKSHGDLPEHANAERDMPDGAASDSTLSCIDFRTAPICGSMIACSTPRLRASYREPKCGRMYWMNKTSAGRLTIRFDPGARSAISDARMFTVVCSVSLVTAHQFDADLIELKPTTRNDGRRRPSSLQPACDHQCFPSKCRLCENGKRTF
ncbi:MAG: hypothetical protein JWP63_4346 [Candidatus Solibacter sp.]|nr:hypothetical protein [Candidatus Solibacter sp.]